MGIKEDNIFVAYKGWQVGQMIHRIEAHTSQTIKQAKSLLKEAFKIIKLSNWKDRVTTIQHANKNLADYHLHDKHITCNSSPINRMQQNRGLLGFHSIRLMQLK